MSNEKKNTFVFVLKKYSKFLSVSLGHFIKHKPVFLKSERVAKQRIYDFLKKSFSLDKSQIDFD